MLEFEDLWQLLYSNGSSNYFKHDCNTLWDELTPDQQQRLYDNIAKKIEQGKFVDYNPKYAIHDNLPRRQAQSIGVPTNYNGSHEYDNLVAKGKLCTAEFNGQVGIYSIEDAAAYHMRIIQRLRPQI